ncbi:hypothetical protein V1514DRAFT_317866 [Lipomyces japonicus]|uniref:uncharacterized protein n=1 Tax=Lipomyces japonicus TaxID=56871 RepID=UPI0034CF626B
MDDVYFQNNVEQEEDFYGVFTDLFPTEMSKSERISLPTSIEETMSSTTVSLARACKACRKRKRKCSRTQPCSLCLKLDIFCEYEDDHEKLNKAKSFEMLSDRIDDLQRMVTVQFSLLHKMIEQNRFEIRGQADDHDEMDMNLPGSHYKRQIENDIEHNVKRKRQQETSRTIRLSDIINLIEIHTASLQLPPNDLMLTLLKTFKKTCNPLIPIVHPGIEEAFSCKVLPLSQKVVLLAITASSLWFCHDTRLGALSLIAFDAVCSGEESQSLVSLMMKGVESLNLGFEEDNQESVKEWTMSEIWRRIFWNIFLFDRFSAVSATEWTPVRALYRIKRRLPCDGFYWMNKVPVKTRCLVSNGLFDLHAENVESEGEKNYLGGFAYRVEAMDMLSSVMRLENAEQDVAELKIDQLDQTLTYWKQNLPDQFSLRPNKASIMNPNLTLAHVTHRTAVILLHHFCVARQKKTGPNGI